MNRRELGIATGAVVVITLIIVAIIAGAVYLVTRPKEEEKPPKEVLRVGFPITTLVEEPWVGVIHKALLRAENEYGIVYEWTDEIGYADLPRVLREWAPKYDIIFSDVFGCEASARAAVKDFPKVQFVMGSGLGPVEPNLAVFDDWIHEPAFIIGIIAGTLTESNVIGVVGGVPIPEVNRLVNAYIQGAKLVNPNVKVKVSFLGEWFDPPRVKELALAQIKAGADVMYAERYGVHDAALEVLSTENKVIPLFGNLLDQWELAPNLVITGPEWDMWPLVKYVIETFEERGRKPFAMDLAEWTMMGKGGAKLAGYPGWHDYQTRLHPTIVEKLNRTYTVTLTPPYVAEDMVIRGNMHDICGKIIDEILAGRIRAPIDETVPVSD